MFDIPFIDLLPPTPEAFVKAKVIELLNYLGYPWPTTEPGALRSAGQAWSSLQPTLQGWVAELEAGVRHISSQNSGPATTAAVNYLNTGDSNLDALRSLTDAAPQIAHGYSLAATVADALRIAVIAEILLDVIQIALAIVTGGVSAGASFLVKQGAGAVIDYLIDQAIAKVLAG